jgi:hypothetical protein
MAPWSPLEPLELDTLAYGGETRLGAVIVRFALWLFSSEKFSRKTQLDLVARR